MALSATARPIEGAVATLGVSDRVAFIRKTYAHLGAALIVFAAATGLLFKYAPQLTWKLSTIAGTSLVGMLGLVAVLVFLMYGAERMVSSSTSRGVQYFGLGLGIALQVFMLLPLIWVLMLKFSHFTPEQAMLIRQGVMVPVLNGAAVSILMQATVITLAIFIGLTLVVVLSKKDFTFLRGALGIATFALIGVSIASLLFGFSMGALFSGLIILLMAGWILFETSAILQHYPPQSYVAAALALFVTIATLFRAVLRILIEMNSNRN